METTIAVANYFIKKGMDENKPVSHMKLQKLIYFAHGWHLAITDGPLINDPIEAWKYGPVVSVIYHQFKQFGNDAIRHLMRDESGNEVIVSNPGAIEILNLVWEEYAKFTSVQLSNLTHEMDSPWYTTLKVYLEKGMEIPRGKDIDEALIKKHFSSKLATA